MILREKAHRTERVESGKLAFQYRFKPDLRFKKTNSLRPTMVISFFLDLTPQRYFKSEKFLLPANFFFGGLSIDKELPSASESKYFVRNEVLWQKQKEIRVWASKLSRGSKCENTGPSVLVNVRDHRSYAVITASLQL